MVEEEDTAKSNGQLTEPLPGPSMVHGNQDWKEDLTTISQMRKSMIFQLQLQCQPLKKKQQIHFLTNKR